MKTHDEYLEAIALHALGLLENAERKDVEAHLESCSSCSAELVSLRETAGELVLLARPLTPSPERIGKLLDALDSETPVSEGPRADREPELRQQRRLRLLGRKPLVWSARLAVAAVIAFLILSQLSVLERLDRAYLEIERMRDIAAFVTSPGVSMVPLWGTEAAPGAHAKLAYEHATGRFMLFSSRMPAPPEGQRYQLWVISDRVRPAAAFSAESPDGTLRTVPSGDAPFLFGVTLEASLREADEPTGGMVLMSGPVR